MQLPFGLAPSPAKHLSRWRRPGATSSEATGVSGNNIVGGYETSSSAGYCFLYNGSTYTTLAPPGVTSSYVVGVSGNNIVGDYGSSLATSGFLYNGSTYAKLAPPVSGLTYSYATGVSGNNVVGYYASSGPTYGFLYNGSTYTTLAAPGHHTQSPKASPATISSGSIATASGAEFGFATTVSSTLSWTGVTNGNWDTGTANWETSGSTATYSDGNSVFFNDQNALTGTNVSNTNVTISGLVSPQSVTFNNTGDANGGVDYTIGGGAIAGHGALTKNGAGTVTLKGANTYTGNTAINAGILNAGVAENPGVSGPFGAQAANAAGTIFFGGGTLQYSAANQFDYSGRFSAAGNQPISIDTNGQTVTFVTAIQGAGTSLTLNDSLGTGTLILTASNTYSGSTTISAGTLQVGNGNASGTLGMGPVTDNAVLVLDRSDNPTFAAAISGSGSLTQAGTGMLTLTGSNTYTGVTTVSGGTLQVGNGGSGEFLASPSVSLSNSTSLAFNHSDALAYSGVISGSGSLTQAGGGTLTLLGSNTFSGGTTTAAGELQVGNGGTTGSLAGKITDNALLMFDRSDNTTYSGVISGGGALSQAGSSILTLAGGNSYQGFTTMTVAIALNNANAVKNSTVIVNPGNLLLFNTNSGAIKTFNLGGLSGYGGISLFGGYPVTLSVGGNGMATTYSGALNGLGGLTKTGKGVLVLTGTIVYAGGTKVSAGTLQIGDGGTTGSVFGNITDSATLAFDRSNNLVLGSAVSGTGRLIQDGGGILTLAGANTYSGGTYWSGGTAGPISLNNANAVKNSTVTVSPGNILLFDANIGAIKTFNLGGLSGSGNISLADGSYPVTLSAGGNRTGTTYSGALSGAGGLTKAGSGNLVLCGSNTFTGGTTVAAGTLKLDFSQTSARRPTLSTTRRTLLPWPWVAARWQSAARPAQLTANASTVWPSIRAVRPSS